MNYGACVRKEITRTDTSEIQQPNYEFYQWLNSLLFKKARRHKPGLHEENYYNP
jgi:hypothetical protein